MFQTTNQILSPTRMFAHYLSSRGNNFEEEIKFNLSSNGIKSATPSEKYIERDMKSNLSS